MVWAPITALAALLIALGYMIWQFSGDDRNPPKRLANSEPLRRPGDGERHSGKPKRKILFDFGNDKKE